MLTSDEKKALMKVLEGNSNPNLVSVITKLTKENSKLKYVYGLKNIKAVLAQAFEKKQNVKVQYYSLSSDETKYRKLSVYQIENYFIVAFCHLRNDERTFVIDRINSIALLSEKYEIPKGWKPKSRVW